MASQFIEIVTLLLFELCVVDLGSMYGQILHVCLLQGLRPGSTLYSLSGRVNLTSIW